MAFNSVCYFFFPSDFQSLDGLVKEKDLEAKQLGTACKNLQWLKQEVEEKLGSSLKEKDDVNSQLQTTLQNCNKEIEVGNLYGLVKKCEQGKPCSL